MLRLRRHCSAAGAVAGAVMVAAAFSGLGSSAAAAPGAASSHYKLTYSEDWSGTSVLVRWAPCTRIAGVTHNHVIRYRVNTAGHASRVGLVERAVAKLSTATGLTFRDVGQTSYIPRQDSGGRLAAHEQKVKARVPFVIAWAYRGTGKHHSNLLTGTEAGVGSISWASSNLSQQRILAGAVVIKRGATSMLKPGFKAGGSIGVLLLHELGHAVGLQHVKDDGQVMYPWIGSSSPGGYAAGDRAGLTKVGRQAGCMTTPPLPV
jgi:hypothetical protein